MDPINIYQTKLDKERLYELFKESFIRSLGDEEIGELQQLSEAFPYFVLPKVMASKSSSGEKYLKEAAVQVSNRKLLRDFLKGKLYFAEIEIDPYMDEQVGRSSFHVHFPPNPFDHFGILEGMGKQSFTLETSSPLSIGSPKAGKQDLAFLQNIVEEKVFRYKGLVSQIRQQLSERFEREAWKFKKTVEADGLVNQFLEQLPQIGPPEFSSLPSQQEEHQAATESLQSDEEEFVTETLARLHLKQNNLEEALRIYELLCLRFPEKSAYFEAQIKKIKQ